MLQQGTDDSIDILLAHLRVNRQQYRSILSEFGLTEIMARLPNGVSGFAVRAHDPPSCRDSLIEQALHHGALVKVVRQTHAIALPIGPGPLGLLRYAQPLEIRQ